jgi:hypothetical protein
MRNFALLISAATLGSCAMNLQPEAPRPVAGASTVAYLLGGKTAGPPIRCMPSYRTTDMTVVDSQTVAFRESGRRTYLVHLSGGCGDIANGAALVTKSYGTDQMCAGDIAHAMMGGSRMIAGSCSVQSIVPYTRPGA